MNTLYIGAKYDIGSIGYADGSAFASAPCVVLYYAPNNTFYEATVTAGSDNTYFATIPAALSATFLSGVYSLEIYSDSTRTEILYHEKESVRAIKAAASATDSTSYDSNS